MKRSIVVGASALAIGFGWSVVDAREASACSPPSRVLVAIPSPVPVDAAVPIIAGEEGIDLAQLKIEATDVTGAPVAVTMTETSPPSRSRLLKATNGELPTGRLRLKLDHPSLGTFENHEITIEPARASSFVMRAQASVSVFTMDDESSPKVRCHHDTGDDEPGMGSCGSGPSAPFTDLASRIKRIPLVTASATEQPAWLATLFAASAKVTVRLADGSEFVEGGESSTIGVSKPGVGYCVELTLTPRFDASLGVRTDRVCVENGDLRFDLTQADHDDALVRKANSMSCSSLDFPDDVPVPEALEDRAGSGCSTSGRPVRSGGALGASLFVVLAGLISRRKRTCA